MSPPVRLVSVFAVWLGLAAGSAGTPAIAAAPWIPDRGDGTYRNPVLFADYSDPDAIRVGGDFYLVSSSFLAVPGLPILHSRDLVNWTLVAHALPELVPAGRFARPRHGEGVWAPAIRYHGGRFWILYPDPDFGIYLTTARDAAGPWTPPVLIEAGRGLIDPCPFWDDDGRLYLIHAWARTRAGIANLLTLQRLSPDGTRALDAGATIIDGNRIPHWHTLEGPKLYKRRGFYYVFAPSGGVTGGYQAVFRARNLYGPYEHRIVLAQGRTSINGPHQGAWVETPSGQDWFLHFQSRGAYGRVVLLEPMAWRDDWPVIGADPGGTGTGEPVPACRLPDVGRRYPVAVPQTTDEFDAGRLGLQWQWNANPRAGWADLGARPGFLRLASVPAPEARNDGTPAGDSLYDAPNLLLQKFPAPEFTVTTALEFRPAEVGERAGLMVFGLDYAYVGLRRTAAGLRLVAVVNRGAYRRGAQEREEADGPARDGPVYLRVTVGPDAVCRFGASFDDRDFLPLGEPFKASGDSWMGAKVGIFASAPPSAETSGFADFDWFRVTPAVSASAVATSGPAAPSRGVYLSKITRVGARLRTWHLFVPANFVAGDGLLIAFHPAGTSGTIMRRRFGVLLERLAREQGFAVAYPDGFQGHFDDCRLGTPYSARRLKVDDVGFARAIVEEVARGQAIDRKRVYALGYSNGAAMALRLALEAPDLVAGVTAICANLPTANNLDCPIRDGPHPTIVLIEGTADRINPYGGGRVRLFGSPTGGGTVRSAEASAEWFARRYGLTRDSQPASVYKLGSLAATWEDWGSPVPHVCLITIRGGGHALPHHLSGVVQVFQQRTFNSDWPVRAACQMMAGCSPAAILPDKGKPAAALGKAADIRHG